MFEKPTNIVKISKAPSSLLCTWNIRTFALDIKRPDIEANLSFPSGAQGMRVLYLHTPIRFHGMRLNKHGEKLPFDFISMLKKKRFIQQAFKFSFKMRAQLPKPLSSVSLRTRTSWSKLAQSKVRNEDSNSFFYHLPSPVSFHSTLHYEFDLVMYFFIQLNAESRSLKHSDLWMHSAFCPWSLSRGTWI